MAPPRFRLLSRFRACATRRSTRPLVLHFVGITRMLAFGLLGGGVGERGLILARGQATFLAQNGVVRDAGDTRRRQAGPER